MPAVENIGLAGVLFGGGQGEGVAPELAALDPPLRVGILMQS